MAFDPRRPQEERKLFPFWTLIVIAGCAALWVFGAKTYQESMAAYRSYAAITQTMWRKTPIIPGVTVDGIDLGGMTREEAGVAFRPTVSRKRASAFSLVVQAGEQQMAHYLRRSADDV